MASVKVIFWVIDFVVISCLFMSLEEQVFCFVFSALFLSAILLAFWNPMFFSGKVIFAVTRIPTKYLRGYLLSIQTSAVPNGFSPATYAFCLGVFLTNRLCVAN